jgi:preprotein translocase subunit SecY
MSGVLPVIFAQSVASLPATILMLCGKTMESEGFWGGFLRVFNSSSVLYAVIYLALIVFFAYFYSTIQFNPVEVANNLKKNGGVIPGIRQGRPTGEYLAKVLNKVTLFGAIFLAIVAVSPIVISIFSTAAANSGLALGGTSIIIVVGVALETVRAIEAQMLMRNYKGFLD